MLEYKSITELIDVTSTDYDVTATLLLHPQGRAVLPQRIQISWTRRVLIPFHPLFHCRTVLSVFRGASKTTFSPYLRHDDVISRHNGIAL